MLAGKGTRCHVTNTFIATHRTQGKTLIKEFKWTGSVEDASRSGRPKTVTDEYTPTNLLAAISGRQTEMTISA